MTAAKLPRRPPPDLADRDPKWVLWDVTAPFWQVANTAGRYATRFGNMRSSGPLRTARFDPHPVPARDDPVERVLYAAVDLPTALAERFQHNREVRCSGAQAPGVYSWRPTRPLRLIDLRDVGALRLGASDAINTGPKITTRAWARAIRECWPEADGIGYTSSMIGRTCVALWAPAVDAMPAHPAFAKLLSDPAPRWQAVLRSAAVEIGFDFFG